MSYIEKKYLNKINEIFENLSNLDQILYNQLAKKSVKNINEIAQSCAECNKNINFILKKYYPEIKEMMDKLNIKSTLKFYYDLIHKLTDLIRNIENFRKVDQEYYDKLLEFIDDKMNLISGKYRNICAQELTAFYDKNSRAQLEKILIEKLESKSRQYFTFGSLEEEIKKIARIEGATYIEIIPADNTVKEELNTAKCMIKYNIQDELSRDKERQIGEKLKVYLESKNYQVLVRPGMVITNADLLLDN